MDDFGPLGIIDETTQKTSELCPVSGDVSRKMEPVARPSYIAVYDASLLEVWASATLYTAEALWPERLAAWELGGMPGHNANAGRAHAGTVGRIFEAQYLGDLVRRSTPSRRFWPDSAPKSTA